MHELQRQRGAPHAGNLCSLSAASHTDEIHLFHRLPLISRVYPKPGSREDFTGQSGARQYVSDLMDDAKAAKDKEKDATERAALERQLEIAGSRWCTARP